MPQPPDWRENVLHVSSETPVMAGFCDFMSKTLLPAAWHLTLTLAPTLSQVFGEEHGSPVSKILLPIHLPS